MEIRVGEDLALAAGHGAPTGVSMFFVGVAAHRAAAQSQRHWVGVAPAHAAATGGAVTGDIGSPFSCTAEVDAPLSVDIELPDK